MGWMGSKHDFSMITPMEPCGLPIFCFEDFTIWRPARRLPKMPFPKETIKKHSTAWENVCPRQLLFSIQGEFASEEPWLGNLWHCSAKEIRSMIFSTVCHSITQKPDFFYFFSNAINEAKEYIHDAQGKSQMKKKKMYIICKQINLGLGFYDGKETKWNS